MTSPAVYICECEATFVREPSKENANTYIEVKSSGKGMSSRTAACNAVSNLFKSHNMEKTPIRKGQAVFLAIKADLTKAEVTDE